MKTISLTLLFVVALSALEVQGGGGAPNGTVNVKDVLAAISRKFNDEMIDDKDTPEEAEGVRPPDDEQTRRVEQFQDEVAKIKNLEDEYYLNSKTFAIGLLKRNKWDVSLAVKQFKRILLWRASNKIDKLGAVEVDQDLLKWFPYVLKSKTRDGCPVLELEAGNWQIADFMESKEFVRDAIHTFEDYLNQIYEKVRIGIRDAPNCNASIGVHDFTGFATKNYAEANALSALVRIIINLENRFPNIFTINIGTNSTPASQKLHDVLVPYLGQTFFVFFKEEEAEKAKEFIRKYMEPENLTLKHFNP